MPIATQRTFSSVGKCTACAMLILVSIGQTTSLANSSHARREGVGVDTTQFHFQKPVAAFRHCLPATGVQVLGGFASPDDWLDPDTNEICNPR
ncbi:hypothetical protein QM467_07055 [Rhodoblastus sp. 17X3]|uniref:hypothetical protein n=1 Tax=Rhodoblastus sp. 17X3 TaxID=3047026 RepID=UPI0024B84961|nr:hypothetical protein [Rhodoblastus sp. 17X3]MDI9847810.1 hypothetical protein [Rhodoblastus sp. 17X3]